MKTNFATSGPCLVASFGLAWTCQRRISPSPRLTDERRSSGRPNHRRDSKTQGLADEGTHGHRDSLTKGLANTGTRQRKNLPPPGLGVTGTRCSNNSHPRELSTIGTRQHRDSQPPDCCRLNSSRQGLGTFGTQCRKSSWHNIVFSFIPTLYNKSGGF